jgi:hypothetical protein
VKSSLMEITYRHRARTFSSSEQGFIPMSQASASTSPNKKGHVCFAQLFESSLNMQWFGYSTSS